MNGFLKYGLLALGGALLVAAGGVAYIAASFDPNDYKAQIIRLVQDRTQRTLRLDGDIKLAFFPDIGADISRVSLSEPNSDQEFAALDGAHVTLALWPLFSGQAAVDEVSVRGLKVALVKFRDGRTNIDDLLGKDESKAANGSAGASAGGLPVKLDIAAVRVERSELDYLDESSGAQYALKNIMLKAGRIASGTPAQIEASATLQSAQPRFDIAAQVKTTLTLELGNPSYRLAGLDLQATGTLPGISNLSAHVATADLTGDAQSFNSSALTLAFGIKQPQQEFKVTFTSPVRGDFESQQFSLPELVVAVTAGGDRLPHKSVSSEAKGSLQLDAARENLQLDLAGGLLQSQVNAKVAVNGFSDPAIRFDIDVDQVDADLYLPKKTEAGSAKSGAAATVQPFDLSALRKLDLEGSLRVGTLKLANIKTSALRIDIKAHNGVLKLKPMSGNLYQGGMNGSITVNVTPAKPAFAIDQRLGDISIAPLLEDAANFDALMGRGNVTLNLDTHGDTVAALKQSLHGSAALSLTDGAIKGIDLAGVLRSFGNHSGTQVQAANKQEETGLGELRASFRVNDGVAHNDDVSLKSSLLRLSGSGDMDIGHDRIDYLAKATLVTMPGGSGDRIAGSTAPVRLSGPFTNLKYTLDLGEMARQAARQKIEEQTEEVESKLLNQLKGGLKGLLP